MWRTVVVFFLIPLLLSFSQDQDLLDLTKKKEEKKGEKSAEKTDVVIHGEGRGIIISTHSKTVPLPLKVTLESFDRSEYRWGEPFVYEVSIENVSSVPFDIPWEPDLSKVKSQTRAGSAITELQLLLFVDQIGRETLFGGLSLYGNSAVATTIKKLQAGGKGKIRAPASWRFGISDVNQRMLNLLPAKLALRAQANLMDYPVDSAKYIPSLSNRLSIEMRKEQD